MLIRCLQIRVTPADIHRRMIDSRRHQIVQRRLTRITVIPYTYIITILIILHSQGRHPLHRVSQCIYHMTTIRLVQRSVLRSKGYPTIHFPDFAFITIVQRYRMLQRTAVPIVTQTINPIRFISFRQIRHILILGQSH